LANLTQELGLHLEWAFKACPTSHKNRVGIQNGFLMLGQPHARIGLAFIMNFLMVGQPHARIGLAFKIGF
jgi:hypothetical protein